MARPAADADIEPGSHTPLSIPAPSGAVIGTLDFLFVAEAVAPRLAELSGLPTWLVLRRHADELVVLLATGPVSDEQRPGTAVDGEHRLAPWLAEGRNWVENDVGAAAAELGRTAPEGVGALVVVPLRMPGAEDFGIVVGLGPDPVRDLAPTLPAVSAVVDLLGTVLALDLDRSRLQRRLDAAQQVASTDGLTGLGNRRAFDQAVQREESRCARFGHEAAIVMVDLDGLKVVNDEHGHAAGDRLLRRAADALRRATRNADVAFRLGGDEFAVLLAEVGPREVTTVVDRLRDGLAAAGVEASMGAAMRRGEAGLHAAIGRADLAMYEDKQRRH